MESALVFRSARQFSPSHFHAASTISYPGMPRRGIGGLFADVRPNLSSRVRRFTRSSTRFTIYSVVLCGQFRGSQEVKCNRARIRARAHRGSMQMNPHVEKSNTVRSCYDSVQKPACITGTSISSSDIAVMLIRQNCEFSLSRIMQRRPPVAPCTFFNCIQK